MKIKSLLYKGLRISNDVKALSKGPEATAKRIGRRAVGKATGRLMGKLFK